MNKSFYKNNTNSLEMINKFYNNQEILKKEDEMKNLNVLNENKLLYLDSLTTNLKSLLQNYDGILQEIEYAHNQNNKNIDEHMIKMTINTLDDVKIYNFIMKGIKRGKIEYSDGIEKLNHCVEKIVKTLQYISLNITFDINKIYMKSKELQQIESLFNILEDYNNEYDNQLIKLGRKTIRNYVENLRKNFTNYDYIIRHIIHNYDQYKDQYLKSLLNDLYLQMKNFNILIAKSKTNYNKNLEESFIRLTETILQTLVAIGTVITKIYNEQQLEKNYPIEKASLLLNNNNNNESEKSPSLKNIDELTKVVKYSNNSNIKSNLSNYLNLNSEDDNLKLLKSLLEHEKNYISDIFYNNISNFIKKYND